MLKMLKDETKILSIKEIVFFVGFVLQMFS
jgi:hypothetical protein